MLSQTTTPSTDCQDPQAPEDLRDIYGFHAIEVPEWLCWFLGILLLAALAYWIYHKFIKKAPPAPLTKFQQVMQDLSNLDPQQDSKEFYLALTEISRAYFEEELFIPALDRTLDELLPALRAHEMLRTPQVLTIKEIFERADLAKFAKAQIQLQDKQEDQRAIISLITEINTAYELKLAAERAKQAALEEDA